MEKVNKTSREWQVFSGEDGERAAEALNATATAELAKVSAAMDALDKVVRSAESVMYQTMKDHAEAGAWDSEPNWVWVRMLRDATEVSDM